MGAEHISWAGRILSGADRFGQWKVNSIDGWYDSPDTKGETSDRPNADGEYDLPTYNQARRVTLTGRLIAKSHADMHEAMGWLTGPMRGRLQVSGHGSSVWADGVRDSGVKVTPETDKFLRWQISLRFPDPRKYGDQATFDMVAGSPVKAFHRGNYAANPIVQVNGPVTGGFTITHPGGLYTAVGDIGAGGWVRVDFRTGRLRLNGNDRSDLVTRADLFTIQPGNTATVTLSNGSGYVEVLDTYI